MLDKNAQAFLVGIYVNCLKRRNDSLHPDSDKKMNVSFLRHRRNERQFSKILTDEQQKAKKKMIDALISGNLAQLRPVDINIEAGRVFDGSYKGRRYTQKLSLTKEGVKLAKNIVAFVKI